MEALLGAIVGILLGAVIQYFADRRKSNAERHEKLRALRQVVYARLLGEGFATIDVISRFATSLPGSDKEKELFGTLKERTRELMTTGAEISLIGPPDTVSKAHALVDASMLIASGGQAESSTNHARRDQAASEFLALARRDVGAA